MIRDASDRKAEREYYLHMQRLRITNRKLFWAKKYHRNTKNERMTFKQSPFLIPLYEALQYEQRVAIIKSVQSGISEALIISHLEEASRGLSILYVLPKGDLRNTFVQNRINRVIQRVPHYKHTLRSMVKEAKADSVIMKIFGDGVIKYVDSNSPANFVEYPADALYLDELDRMNQANVEMAPDRLSASRFKYERAVSNPTVEDFGIDERWKESTQGVWNIKCTHCNTWQHPDWFVNVVNKIGERQYEALDKKWSDGEKKEADIYCYKCHGTLNRFAIGEYVHKTTSKDIKGFHINKIFGSPYTTMSDLLKKFWKALANDTRLQIFFNSDLGIPYSSAQSKITATDLNECKIAKWYQPAKNDGGVAVMGVDVGAELNVIIRKIAVADGVERKKLLFAGTVKRKEELYKLAKQFDVKSMVVDALPETRMVEAIQDHVSFAYKCFYHEGKNPIQDKKTRTLTVDRTTLLDEVKENVDLRSYGNFANMTDVIGYYEQLQANTRIYDPDRNKFVWVQSSKADHYTHAEAYCLLAFKLRMSSNVFEFYEAMAREKASAVKDGQKVGQTQTQVMKNIVDTFYGTGNKKDKKTETSTEAD